MTAATALAFVALGFVGGALSVALIWRAMNHVASLADYRNGFDDGRAQGLEDGGDLVFSLACDACRAKINRHNYDASLHRGR
jgi:ferric-dicitrate binding protein FerR (iron transport regulator)